MVDKIILPDSCEPIDFENIPDSGLPQLVFMVFGLFRYDKPGDKGVHSTRGEWLIVDELLKRGEKVMAVQIAPRHNVRVVKDRRKQPEDANSPNISSIASRTGGEIGGGTRVGTDLSKDKVTGSELDDDYELHKEPYPDPRFIAYPNQWQKVRCSFDSPLSIAEVVQECIINYGKVDIIINWLDLGFDYGEFTKKMLTGNIPSPPTEVQQQQEEMELRKLMDQNTFSLFNIIKGTLPALRRNATMNNGNSKSNESKGKAKSKSKTNSTSTSTIVPKLISISSSFGFVGGPGINAYTTSRWACEGMMETLNYEIQDQGIRTTTIDLGIQPLHNAKTNSLGTLIWELSHCKNPPIRIALGRQATKTVKDKLRSIVEEVEDWKYIFEPSKSKTKS